MGYTALLIFAGLQAIPNHVYEVAKLDGASPSQTFWRSPCRCCAPCWCWSWWSP